MLLTAFADSLIDSFGSFYLQSVMDWMTVMSGRNISSKVLCDRLADVVFADAKYRLVSEGVLVREAPAGKRCCSNGICQIAFHPPPLKQKWTFCGNFVCRNEVNLSI